MKKLLQVVALSIIAISFMNSCSSVKRRYSPGYTVIWNSKSKSKKLSSPTELSSNKKKVSEMEKITPISVSNVSNISKVQEVKTPTIEKAYERLETENTVASNEEAPVLWNTTTKLTRISNNNLNSESELVQEFKNEKKLTKNLKDSSQGEGDKSWVVALVLCLLIGVLGIHRFYLGYTGLGVLYLLTGGLCGIGVLIDFIMLLTGSLKPKNGNYNDK
jgi:TM2 domain-containing membrane protein YozV